MIVLGLTGSIGMGKSTTAAMFKDAGVPVWDADAAVHRLYAPGGAGVAAVAAAFPGVVRDGAVDRGALAARLGGDRDAFVRLESVVHPLVREDREAFLRGAEAAGAQVAVVDIPLLFETGAEDMVDAVVVVTAPAAVQRERVLARPGMDEARLAAILARQVPDEFKRAKADFVVDTSLGLESARAAVHTILAAVRAPDFKSRPRGLDRGGEPIQ